MLTALGAALVAVSAYRVIVPVSNGGQVAAVTAGCLLREKFDAAEVRLLFKNAAPTMRVLVLGLIQGDPSLADRPTIVDAIQDPCPPTSSTRA